MYVRMSGLMLDLPHVRMVGPITARGTSTSLAVGGKGANMAGLQKS